MTSPPVAAIILAAGKGTRMKSALPKVLHHACGKPLVAWPIDAAFAAGAQPVVVVTGHGRERVDTELSARFGTRIRVVHQDEQRGTGHAARLALSALEGFEGTILIGYGDSPLLTHTSLAALADLRARMRAPVALWTTRLSDPTGYGRIVRNAEGVLTRIVEHKDATSAERAIVEVNPGVYAADAAFLRQALRELRADNAQGEFYLTDVVSIARAAGHEVPTLEVEATETWGVNDRVQLAGAAAELRRRIVHRAMLDGVTFIDPSTAFIDATVRFGTDVTVGPHVTVRGASHIEDDVQVGAGVVIADSTVCRGAVIHPYSVLEHAHVGPGCVVGPFARLRPDAVLEEGAHVGNFVELKKTRLGRMSKANHLAYLGDADIGAGANIGAGTITCNYDGFGKHRTTIGNGVFVGSNSTLVAPIDIAHDAYIAAGSVVTDPVPADALALGRGRQVNKEGYAQRVRESHAARAAATKAQLVPALPGISTSATSNAAPAAAAADANATTDLERSPRKF